MIETLVILALAGAVGLALSTLFAEPAERPPYRLLTFCAVLATGALLSLAHTLANLGQLNVYCAAGCT